jgi:hypothetical protein
MRSLAMKTACALVLFGAVSMTGVAQHNGSDQDPRVGLKAGLHNAGEAAHNLERIASVPKPQGFFDPKAPSGEPTPPETTGRGSERGPSLNFANSDVAFSGRLLFLGNFNGFNIYDVEQPRKPKLLTSVICPGGQGDVSVYGHLVVMSVEQTRGRVDCGTEGVATPVSNERFRGVRIFDISDIRKPKQVAAVQTCRGSHTHTIVTNARDKNNLYVYGSGTSTVRSADELAGCSGLDPKDDPNTALFSIDVIQVPLAEPAKAHIVNRPRIFADQKTGALSGLWPGGDYGPGTQTSRVTNQCHDITVFPELGLAAGACAGNGILLDISDPVKPVRLDAVSDKNFAYWHSATFNNDGTKVIFTDEWGGGTRPRCRASDLPNWGADAVFAIVDRKMRFAGYYKMPAPQTEQENCVAHNGSLIPVPGRDIMVQAWYQGGVSVFDFTDSAKPVEIAFFDRGPLDAHTLITGGFWSTYWYNGYIYGTEIARGIDVFRLTPSEHLSQHEIEAATLVRSTEFNAQNQAQIRWASSPTVAWAYVDQLSRAKAMSSDRRTAVQAAIATLERSDKRSLAPVDDLVTALEGDASRATGRDADRLRALATTLKELAAKLRTQARADDSSLHTGWQDLRAPQKQTAGVSAGRFRLAWSRPSGRLRWYWA